MSQASASEMISLEELNQQKQFVKKLLEERDEIEAELQSVHGSLHAPGELGLKGGLLDAEGFPLNDVEKVSRKRLGCL
tara:strand:+ start:89 stop:322 length:234 start_codon:yes stop_codon:yes gene_type:complete